ncbi:UNVERIFIED_CONTAM: hypothetical protein ABIC26_000076 [Paenibacillus sp. PvR008]
MSQRKSAQLLQQLIFVGPMALFFVLIMVIAFLLVLYFLCLI